MPSLSPSHAEKQRGFLNATSFPHTAFGVLATRTINTFTDHGSDPEWQAEIQKVRDSLKQSDSNFAIDDYIRAFIIERKGNTLTLQARRLLVESVGKIVVDNERNHETVLDVSVNDLPDSPSDIPTNFIDFLMNLVVKGQKGYRKNRPKAIALPWAVETPRLGVKADQRGKGRIAKMRDVEKIPYKSAFNSLYTAFKKQDFRCDILTMGIRIHMGRGDGVTSHSLFLKPLFEETP